MPTDQFELLILEEYRALRAESLRCAGIISNTIWVGITQYAATCIAVLALKSKFEFAPLLLIILLMLESLASTSMYLSEIFKYSRIGRYIREKIESSFATDNSLTIQELPISWEHWILDKRSKLFYILSLFTLQVPILTCFFLLIFSKSLIGFHAIAASIYSSFGGVLLILLYFLMAIDISLIAIMGIRIIREGKARHL